MCVKFYLFIISQVFITFNYYNKSKALLSRFWVPFPVLSSALSTNNDVLPLRAFSYYAHLGQLVPLLPLLWNLGDLGRLMEPVPFSFIHFPGLPSYIYARTHARALSSAWPRTTSSIGQRFPPHTLPITRRLPEMSCKASFLTRISASFSFCTSQNTKASD